MANWPFRADCVRAGCGHSSDVHSFMDGPGSNNPPEVSPVDDEAKFRCQVCGPEKCPDMVRSVDNLKALEEFNG